MVQIRALKIIPTRAEVKIFRSKNTKSANYTLDCVGGGRRAGLVSRPIVFAIRILLGWSLDRALLKYTHRGWAHPADAERKSATARMGP